MEFVAPLGFSRDLNVEYSEIDELVLFLCLLVVVFGMLCIANVVLSVLTALIRNLRFQSNREAVFLFV
tara:strand:- start:235 stop:438 length:204 start_codon:yes stop_codon:yes gene_type:complete